MTNLFNARPTWLDHAHVALDAAVFTAYDWPADLSAEASMCRPARVYIHDVGLTSR
jgi:hypothetical protein